MDAATDFNAERPRLVRLAAGMLGDQAEAEDVVQQVWLRLHHTDQEIANLPGWLTTVATRLCLDRLRQKLPTPVDDLEHWEAAAPDPADEVDLAETVGLALNVVLDRLTPTERVAFVLHDSFGFDFATIGAILDSTPTAARKLASRARAKIAQPPAEDSLADWEIVDAFLAASRGGDFGRLMELLAPDVVIAGDSEAVALGTPGALEGRETVASFFNGAAKGALPVFVGDRPGAAWVHRGEAKVAFDFTIDDGAVRRIDFRADPAVLAQVTTRKGGSVAGRNSV